MPSRHVDFQSELAARLSAGAQQLAVPWSPERAERIRAGIVKRHQTQVRRRKLLRTGGLAVLFLCALGLPRVGSLIRGRSDVLASAPASPPSVPAAAPGSATSVPAAARPSSLRLVDGSSAQPRGNSAVAVREEGSSRVTVELLQGGAEFSVVAVPARLFRVAAGGVTVESTGSHFSVDTQPAPQGGPRSLRVAVAVNEGRVRVFWAGQQAVLVAGERVEFQVAEKAIEFTTHRGSIAPSPSVDPSVARASAPAVAPTLGDPQSATKLHAGGDPLAGARTMNGGSASASWKQLARSGQFDQAYQQAFVASHRSTASRAKVTGDDSTSVVLSPLLPSNPDPADLLLLADVARLSHHPASAVSPLRRLIDQHGDDPRASLAAFTLGRLLLDDLGQPREAAQSFRRTQALEAQGPLAHDALAREVEAWSRAGDLARARERAREYIRLYPSGRRVAAVRRFADLPTASQTQSTADRADPTP